MVPLPTELDPALEVPDPLCEASEPELAPELEPDPDPEPDRDPERDPELVPELELAPLSIPAWEALDEEPPQLARTLAAIRATYGEVRVNLFAIRGV
jgi:hypothetical protein